MASRFLSNVNILTFHPSLTLPVQQIMLLTARLAPSWSTVLTPVTWHVKQHLDTHRLLLTVRQVLIAGGKPLQFGVVQLGHLVGIDRDEFVLRDLTLALAAHRYLIDNPYLFIPMPYMSGTPLAVVHLDPEEAESTVALGVGLTSIQIEALRDGCFHFGDGSSGLSVDVRADAVASMHDECTVVHALLRGRDEI